MFYKQNSEECFYGYRTTTSIKAMATRLFFFTETGRTAAIFAIKYPEKVNNPDLGERNYCTKIHPAAPKNRGAFFSV